MDKELLTPEEENKWLFLNDPDCLNIYNEYFEKCSNCGKRAFHFFKAPSKVIVEIWVLNIQCYKCDKITQVIWPVNASINSLNYSMRFDTFENLPLTLSKEFPFFKMTFKKTMGIEDYGNTCINCEAYQGDFYIMKEYLEEAYFPEKADTRYFEVELNDSERLYFSEHEIVEKFHYPRKGSHSVLCKDCYKLYKSGKI